jgi:hypothetical protein
MDKVLADEGVASAIRSIKAVIAGKRESLSPEDVGQWEIELLIGVTAKAVLLHSQELTEGDGGW